MRTAHVSALASRAELESFLSECLSDVKKQVTLSSSTEDCKVQELGVGVTALRFNASGVTGLELCAELQSF